MRVIIYCPVGKVYLPLGRDFFIKEAIKLANKTWDNPSCEVIDERSFSPKYTPEDLTGVICRPGNGKIFDHFTTRGIDVYQVTGRFTHHTHERVSNTQHPSFNQIQYIPLRVEEHLHSSLAYPRMHIIIGIRINNAQRLENAYACLKSLNDQSANRSSYIIILVEESSDMSAPKELVDPVDRYEYIFSDCPYNRSRVFNHGVKITCPDDSAILCLMDADLLVDKFFIERCIGISDKRDIVIPYDNIKYLTEQSSIWARKDRLQDDQFAVWKYDGIEKRAHGGAVLVKTSVYNRLEGHDENFVGWGCEDSDFILRALREFNVWRSHNVMAHMFHLPAEKGPINRKNLEIYLSKHPYADTARRRLQECID